MARLFDDAQNEYLAVLLGAIAEPFTLAAWGYTDSITLGQAVLSVGDASGADYHAIRFQGNEPGDPIWAITWDGAAESAAMSTTGYSANTWHHLCGVWVASDERHVYLDGEGHDDSLTNRIVAGADRATIGVTADSTPVQYMSGRIAEAAIWVAALTQPEVRILAAGYSPLFVRPQSLLAYWALIRDEDQDRVGGLDMTAFNIPSIAPHPPVLYPAPFSLSSPTAAPVWRARHMSMTGVQARIG